MFDNSKSPLIVQDSIWQEVSTVVPTPINLHCMINIVEDKYLLIGGMNQDEPFSKQTLIFHAGSRTWNQGPSLVHGRRSHSCSKATHQVVGFIHSKLGQFGLMNQMDDYPNTKYNIIVQICAILIWTMNLDY